AEEEDGDADAPAETFGEDLVPPVVPGGGVHQADHHQEHRQVPVDAHGEERGHHAAPPFGLATGAGCGTAGVTGGGGAGGVSGCSSPSSPSAHFGGSRNIGPASAS